MSSTNLSVVELIGIDEAELNFYIEQAKAFLLNRFSFIMKEGSTYYPSRVARILRNQIPIETEARLQAVADYLEAEESRCHTLARKKDFSVVLSLMINEVNRSAALVRNVQAPPLVHTDKAVSKAAIAKHYGMRIVAMLNNCARVTISREDIYSLNNVIVRQNYNEKLRMFIGAFRYLQACGYYNKHQCSAT
jgi:hypothetical protein